MAGRFFTAAALVAAAFVSPAVAADNSTASTFSYSNTTDEVANTPATAEYGKDRSILVSLKISTDTEQQHFWKSHPSLTAALAHLHTATDQLGYPGDRAFVQSCHRKTPTANRSSDCPILADSHLGSAVMELPCHKASLGAQGLARTQIHTRILLTLA